MDVEGESPETLVPEADTGLPERDTGARIALVVFGLVELVALPLLLHLARARWFINDDWYFLVTSTTHKPRLLLTPNSWGHWLTLPFLAYRFLFWLFGLRHFKAYLLLVILLHLVAAALIRAVMRRCGAGPWVSTAAATLFVFLGAGADGIFEPVQISFDGSLVFGLSHLLLADHDGKIDARDYLGLACGLAGLMCSNVAIAMVAVIVLAVFWRRGWRAALLHLAPLVAVYLGWWFEYARRVNHRLLSQRASVGQLIPFVTGGLRTTFDALGHSHNVGFVLIVLVVVGLVLAWWPVGEGRRRRSAAAVALAVGAVVFIASVGVVRASPALSGAGNSRYVSRYINVSAALLLPALAVAASALARRWRLLLPIVLVALLVGLPGNYHDLSRAGARFRPNYRHRFLVLAHSPVLRQLPGPMRVPPQGNGYMTVGWLRAGADSGRIPVPAHITEAEAGAAALELQLSPYVLSGRHRECATVRTDPFVVEKGDQLVIGSGTVNLVSVAADGSFSAPMRITARARYQVFVGALRLHVKRVFGHRRVVLKRCILMSPSSSLTTRSAVAVNLRLPPSHPARAPARPARDPR